MGENGVAQGGIREAGQHGDLRGGQADISTAHTENGDAEDFIRLQRQPGPS